MPIGHYIDCAVTPTCGLVNEFSFIDTSDEESSFYDPNRFSAQLIWFNSGFLEYRFPNKLLKFGTETQIEFSMELCSEAPHYRNNWPSDITLWVNDIEVGTWTSPGDLGGRRGRLNPFWWSDSHTQYGILKKWSITEEGSFIDNMKVSDLIISELNLNNKPFISMKVGVKEDATNKGGINIFGKNFGDYAQDIFMRIDYNI